MVKDVIFSLQIFFFFFFGGGGGGGGGHPQMIGCKFELKKKCLARKILGKILINDNKNFLSFNQI